MEHHHTTQARLAKVVGGVALAAICASAVLAGTGPAGADPKQLDGPLHAMGSDTTQDVLDAFAGHVNGRRFIPLRSASVKSAAGVETGQKQIANWRAVEPDASGNPKPCVSPAGGVLVDRPNGSSNGVRALSASITPGRGWGRTDVGCTNTYDNMAGLISFARSSSPASGTSGALTYVPFARDALQFAYSAPSAAAAVSDLTTAQVQALHRSTSGSAVLAVGGTRIIACRIQDGSGTYQSWGTNMGLTVPSNTTDKQTLETSTAECARAFGAVEQDLNGLQEHDPIGLKAVCDRIRAGYTPVGGGAAVPAQPSTQCMVGYSVANWVAQYNGVGSRQLPIVPTASTGGPFNIGTRDGGAAGYLLTGSPAVATPNPAYYAGNFGRDVYNVIPTGAITAAGFTSLRTMLLAGFDAEGPGSGPAMCSAEAAAIRDLLGFGSPVDHPCGAYGSFLKRAVDLNNTGPVGTPEA